MSNVVTFRGYKLEYYPQPNNTYWGICRELGIRVREDTLEEVKSRFREALTKAKYLVYILWRCDQEEYYCTDSERYVIEDLQEHLPELTKKIQEIESRNTIELVEMTRL
jgi:hypothetical protein